MWMMPLHLHVNQKSDYDYDDYDEEAAIEILVGQILCDSLRLNLYRVRTGMKSIAILNIQDCLEKSLKIQFALKSP